MSQQSVKRIDHVGIAVRDVAASIPYYVEVLGLRLSTTLELADGSARVAYLDAGDTTVQLVQPLRPGPVATFLESHGEGIHHICFAVDDLEPFAGPVGGQPGDGIRMGGRGDRVLFITNQPNGVVIELSEPAKELKA